MRQFGLIQTIPHTLVATQVEAFKQWDHYVVEVAKRKPIVDIQTCAPDYHPWYVIHSHPHVQNDWVGTEYVHTSIGNVDIVSLTVSLCGSIDIL